MPWKLSRWKPCDGGCCVRSPRFPNPIPGPDLTRPAWKAGCRYQMHGAGGTSPDGIAWRGGCVVYKELLDLLAAKGGNAARIKLSDLAGLSNFQLMLGTTTEPLRTIDPRGGLHWFFNTCWQWPARTATLQAIMDRLTALGIWDKALADPALDYAKIYTDEERQAAAQEFHVTDAQVKAGTAANEEPACCTYWEFV